LDEERLQWHGQVRELENVFAPIVIECLSFAKIFAPSRAEKAVRETIIWRKENKSILEEARKTGRVPHQELVSFYPPYTKIPARVAQLPFAASIRESPTWNKNATHDYQKSCIPCGCLCPKHFFQLRKNIPSVNMQI
jgi:hypothetical protein